MTATQGTEKQARAAPITPRRYQSEAVTAALNARGSRRLIVAPVGSGKTIMISELTRRLLEMSCRRILVVTHSSELVVQNASKVAAICSGVEVGVLAGSLERRDVDAKVIVANISSAHVHADAMLAHGAIDAVVIDEAHRLDPDGVVYAETLAKIHAKSPSAIVFGLTGSPWRSGHGHICMPGPKGEAPIFGTLAHVVEHSAMLDAKFIVPVRPRRTSEKIWLKGVKLNAFGDYAIESLDKKLNSASINERAVAETISYAREHDRKRWLMFSVTIDHAEALARELAKHEVPARVVSARTPTRERNTTIEAYRAGELTALVNVAALGTGFDVPEIDLISLLRPTCSRALYYQMLGRGTRPADGKTDCVVLDFCGSSLIHGPLEFVDWESREHPLPGWGCEKCDLVNARAAKRCADCGSTKPPPLAAGFGRTAPDAPSSETDLSALAAMLHTGEPVGWSGFTFLDKEGTRHLKIVFDLGDCTVAHTIWFSQKFPGWQDTLRKKWSEIAPGARVPGTAKQALDLLLDGAMVLPRTVTAVPKASERSGETRIFWNVKKIVAR